MINIRSKPFFDIYCRFLSFIVLLTLAYISFNVANAGQSQNASSAGYCSLAPVSVAARDKIGDSKKKQREIEYYTRSTFQFSASTYKESPTVKINELFQLGFITPFHELFRAQLEGSFSRLAHSHENCNNSVRSTKVTTARMVPLSYNFELKATARSCTHWDLPCGLPEFRDFEVRQPMCRHSAIADIADVDASGSVNFVPVVKADKKTLSFSPKITRLDR